MNKEDLAFFEQPLPASSSFSLPTFEELRCLTKSGFGAVSGKTTSTPSLEGQSEATVASHDSSADGDSGATSGSGGDDVTADSTDIQEEKADPQLIPRQYQSELFQRAQKGNVIAVMDTGSGKTLVSVLLIKEMLARERNAKRSPEMRKISFFVVNNVPLVFQQASVIRNNCNADVRHLCGAMSSKKLSKDLWSDVFGRVDVVVLTAQILLDLLRHGCVQMKQIALLIFDECHHARKNHPFSCIMEEFYHDRAHCSLNERPKVFGMTASPASDFGSIVSRSASKLERLLDAQIFTADEEQVGKFVDKPMEFTTKYPPSPKYQATALTTNLRHHCSSVTKLEPLFKSALVNLGHLGPWCVDQLWRVVVFQGLKSNKSDSRVLEESRIATLIVNQWKFAPPSISDTDTLSPKVIKLVQLLRVAGMTLMDEFCGIIFVQRRDTAIALGLLLHELRELDDFIQAQVLLGHNDESEGADVLRMTFKEQDKIIKGFRDKEYNLLIATSVAEEGLDIQPCNLVIRFDALPSTISYIQSRGRARQKNSRFIVMQEQGSLSDEGAYGKARYGEKSMRDWCHSLDQDRVMQCPLPGGDDNDTAASLSRPSSNLFYRVPATGALLTPESAVSLLNNYCNTLTKDEFSSVRPIFTVVESGASAFVCDLVLPSTAPLRLVQSDWASTKRMAKKSAAFKACEKLHALGALNDNLLPTIAEDFKKFKEEEQSPEFVETRTAAYPVNRPAFWNLEDRRPGTVDLYGCVVILTPENTTELDDKHLYRPMVLLTWRPIPCEVPPTLLFVSGARYKGHLKSIPRPMQADPSQQDRLHKFTQFMFGKTSRRELRCPIEDIPFLIAPLVSRPTKFQGDFFIKKCLGRYSMNDPLPKEVTRSSSTTTEAEKEAKADLKNTEPSPPPSQDPDTIGSYFEIKLRMKLDSDDIILLAEQSKRSRNHLQPSTQEEPPALPILLPLSRCMDSPLSASILRAAAMLPSLLYNLDSTLLVFELQQRINLMDVRLDLLQTALTSSAASRAFQYERLELLGDSFLKFSSTIRLYIVNPAKDEGQLHQSRIRIISNSSLFQHAIRHEFFRYIQTAPFPRRSWRPQRYTVDGKASDNGAQQTHELSLKTLADVVEAILGAAFVSGGAKVAFQVAKTLGIPFSEFMDWDDLNPAFLRLKARNSESTEAKSRAEMSSLNPASSIMTPSTEEAALQMYSSLPQPMTEDWQYTVQSAEKIFGYKFKDPRLFLEAMTHSSYIGQKNTMCYQRLEFLGDAVLDFQVVWYYYRKFYDAPPGVITLVKDASVNNRILAALSILWDLPKLLRHTSPTMVMAIHHATEALQKRKEEAEAQHFAGEYWIDVAMPKVLGDLVEASLGAILVDCGFNMDVITDIFNRMIRPFLDKHVSLDQLISHPTSTLIENLQKFGCTNFKLVHYDMGAKKSESEEGGDGSSSNVVENESVLKLFRRLKLTSMQQEAGEAEMECGFVMHDQEISRVKGHRDIYDLRKEASLQALARLRREPELLKRLCSCPKKRKTGAKTTLDRYQEQKLHDKDTGVFDTDAKDSLIATLIAATDLIDPERPTTQVQESGQSVNTTPAPGVTSKPGGGTNTPVATTAYASNTFPSNLPKDVDNTPADKINIAEKPLEHKGDRT
ncbi:Dicer-like protein 1, partial [Lunasporangiospora selenospora]